MKLRFWKYHGTGNDFIVLDNRSGAIRLTTDQIVAWCSRRFGIGSDGVILIEPDAEADFYMRFLNPDGSESFCGNGSRCAVAFFRSIEPGKSGSRFRAVDGMHESLVEGSLYRIRMKDVDHLSDLEDGSLFVDTGSPHIVWMTTELDKTEVVDLARRIRYSNHWKKDGVNVNFTEVISEGLVAIRTYERGVEDETWSCGTGVTAAALACARELTWRSPITVRTRGGDLSVAFEPTGHGGFTDIWLSGPAERVFEGEIEWNKEV